MRISPINLNKTNFSSTDRTVYFDKQDGRYSLPNYTTATYNPDDRENSTKMIYSNRTFFFRKDLPWKSLPVYLCRQFRGAEKINVYNFACSDGSEPYSLAISLINDLGEAGARRFFPIKASDVDENVIEQAKKGTIKATSGDMAKLERIIYKPKTIHDFFDVERDYENHDFPYILHPKEILTKNVQFECKSIEEGLDEVEKSNSLVLARNFWRYLSIEELASASMKLRKNLDSSSRVIIGDFDKTGDPISKASGHSIEDKTPAFLMHLGFRPADFEPCNPYENVLKIGEYHDSIFLHEPQLWLEQVKQDYKAYKLPYGIH
ncbi:MAG: hypothetical protein IKL52_06945 [Candidatus Gastranaerophilales bacterium]|nr:hypothetical protein [Candidatus Gastranaerophilales bacterium]